MGRILLTLTIAGTMLLATATAATAEIKIGFVYFDSPGSDTGSNASLNAEYVKIKNTGSRAKVLTGWRLHDQSHHRYTFGTLPSAAAATSRSTPATAQTRPRIATGAPAPTSGTTPGDKATLVKPSG